MREAETRSERPELVVVPVPVETGLKTGGYALTHTCMFSGKDQSVICSFSFARAWYSTSPPGLPDD